jgi:hypothetical protein
MGHAIPGHSKKYDESFLEKEFNGSKKSSKPEKKVV